MIPIFVKNDDKANKWASTMLAGMSLNEKIAQLIHVAAWSNKGSRHQAEIESLIRDYKIGGLIFFQGDPEGHAFLINRYQQLSKVPLFMSLDGEWGLAMRLDRVEAFPYQMTLGATADPELVRQMGTLVAGQFRRLGLQINFAPVVDINTNPENPVISFRSFGEDKDLVTTLGTAYMQGLQNAGVLASAKHFPGHGDTSVDSHTELPVLNKTREEIAALEAYPFRCLAERGLASVMTGHLSVPALEIERHLPSSLSPAVVREWLVGEMGYQGLIFTDALDMKAVSKYYKSGEAELRAFKAGNDVLLFSVDVPKAIAKIKAAVSNGEVEEPEIEHRCRKQLLAKYWAGLSEGAEVQKENLIHDLNVGVSAFNEKAFASAITVLANKRAITGSVASVAIFADGLIQSKDGLSHHSILKSNNNAQSSPNTGCTLFQELLGREWSGRYECFNFWYNEPEAQLEDFLSQLGSFDTVIVGIHNLLMKSVNNFGVTELVRRAVDQVIENQENVFVSLFGNAYALGKFERLHEASGLLVTYQETEYAHQCASRVLTHQLRPGGCLPVTVNRYFRRGDGLSW